MPDSSTAPVEAAYRARMKLSVPGGPYGYHAEDPLKADLEMPVGYYGQPLYFAQLAQRYRHEFGLTSEQLGSLAVAQREWAARTPGSQKPERITMTTMPNRYVGARVEPTEDAEKLFREGKISGVVNIPTQGRNPGTSGFALRQLAVRYKVPCFTHIDTLNATILFGMGNEAEAASKIRTIRELHNLTEKIAQ